MVRIGAFLVAGLAGLATAKSAVLDLIPSNFDEVVLSSGKPTLVEFFAPWCGHCKNLAPIYEELAETFSFSDKVQIAKVDADAQRDLGKKYGVQGFPTLKFFDGKSKDPVDYSSGRDIDSLTAFISEKTGVLPRKKYVPPSDIQYLTDSSFTETVGGDKDVFVAFTAPWCGHCKKLAPTWEKLATDFALEEGVVIAKVDVEGETSKQTAKDEGIKSYPTIKFFPRGSKTGEVYSGPRDEQDLVTFVNEKANTHRLVGGGLDEAAGTISELDDIVAKFRSGGQKLTEAADKAKKAASALQADVANKFAEYYVRVFDKLNQNENYVSKELARLQGILEKSGLAPAKTDELKSKTNILRKFAEEPEAKDAEAKDEAKDEL